MVDYYNDMPSGINVIDKMNAELDDLQKKYDELEQKLKELNDTIWIIKIMLYLTSFLIMN